MPKISQKFYRQTRAETNSALKRINAVNESESSSQFSNNEHQNNISAILNCNLDIPPDCETVSSNDSDSNCSSDINTCFNPTEVYGTLNSCGASDLSQCVAGKSEGTSDLSALLAEWAVKNHITHCAVNDLLQILNPFMKGLPKDARTLLQTPRNIDKITDIEPGHYYHFGLENTITKLLCEVPFPLKDNSVEIFINIDGLPVSKSSSSQFYPILCSLVIHPNLVDMIGIYHGYEKPRDANAFLRNLVDEIIYLTNNGFYFKTVHHFFKVKAFICDVPAKSFILYTKGHSGYYSCTKCDIEGAFVNGRVCFPSKHFNLRSDLDFRQKIQEDHHTGTSILETIPNINMIDDFPLDPMHLLYLGIVKKLLTLWLTGRPPAKLSYSQVENISSALLALRANIPSEFNRKPRSLKEYKRWKATELRQFILYTGPVVLKSVVNRDIYLNFLSLHIALTILSSSRLQENYKNYAATLLTYFVDTFITLYGEENVSHNVHNLLHLCKDSDSFGNLANYSAFPFENYMQKILKCIRKNEKPLEQIILRKAESDKISFDNICQPLHNSNQMLIEHCEGPTLDLSYDSQFKKVILKDFSLTVNAPDNFCCLRDGNCVIIKNFIVRNGKESVLGMKFNNIQSLYSVPCTSSTFGINVVQSEDVGSLEEWTLEDIGFKYIPLEINEKRFALFPLLHA